MRVSSLMPIACLVIVGCADSVINKADTVETPTAVANEDGFDDPPATELNAIETAPATELIAIETAPATELNAIETAPTTELNAIETASAKDAPMTDKSTSLQYNELNDFEKHVLLNKGTERAFTGEYTDLEDKGTYVCRRCNAALYLSDHKFHSNCGWPAFDDEIEGAVTHLPDADGRRTEIICTNCGGHLGHVFVGEQMTEKNTRHCVNSVSMNFVAAADAKPKTISSNSAE